MDNLSVRVSKIAAGDGRLSRFGDGVRYDAGGGGIWKRLPPVAPCALLRPLGTLGRRAFGAAGCIGALAAGIGVYVLTQESAETATDKANKKLAEQVNAIKEAQAARQEEVAGIQAEYGHYQQLWNELQGIVDQNGKVKEGYEERAAFITSTLSDALGVEIEMTDGTIQKYGELAGSIDQVIQRKKAEALMNAYQGDYTEAIKNEDEAA